MKLLPLTAALLSSALIIGVTAGSVNTDEKALSPHFDLKVSVADTTEGCSQNSLVAMAKPDITAEELEASEVVVEAIPLISDESYAMYKLELAYGYEPGEAMDIVASNDDILHVQPDFELEPESYGGSDLSYETTKQWHHEAIHTLEAWDLIADLPSHGTTKVAVIDYSFYIWHPDLCVNVDLMNSCDMSSGKPTYLSTFGTDVHGTHVAGIIGGTSNNGTPYFGVASGYDNKCVQLLCISISGGDINVKDDDDDHGFISSLIAGVGYASKMGCKVCNISLGTPKSNVTQDDATMLEAAFKTARNKGMICGVASGNNGSSRLEYPSCLDCVYSVGELTLKNGKLARSEYSSYGKIEISAPGTGIASTSTGNAYFTTSGTSMASPMFVAVTALVLAADPSLTSEQAADIVCRTALDLGDNKTGVGCINAYAAVYEAVRGKYGNKYGSVNNALLEQPEIDKVLYEIHDHPATVGAGKLMGNLYRSVGWEADYDILLSTSSLIYGDITVCDLFQKFFYSYQFQNAVRNEDYYSYMLIIFKGLFNRTPNVNEYWMSIYYMSNHRWADLPGLLLKDPTLMKEFQNMYPNLEYGDFYSSSCYWN